jgi:uncharacterized repeat protein (TIGR03843 family)
VQEWIDIDESIDLATFYKQDDARLRTIALFDAVINNTDRKIGHLLPTLDSHLFACDHGVTFHVEDKLRTVLWQWADKPLNEREISDLNALKIHLEQPDCQIIPLITNAEYEALLSRIARLISSRKFPLPNPDWPAVPWPPF